MKTKFYISNPGLPVAPTVRAASGEARAGSEVASQRTARRMPAAGPLRRGFHRSMC